MRALTLVMVLAACSSAPSSHAPRPRAQVTPGPAAPLLDAGSGPPAAPAPAPAVDSATAELVWTSDSKTVIVDGTWHFEVARRVWTSPRWPDYRARQGGTGRGIKPNEDGVADAVTSPDGTMKVWRRDGEWPLCFIASAHPGEVVCYGIPTAPADDGAARSSRLRGALRVGRDIYWAASPRCARYRVVTDTDGTLTLEHRDRVDDVDVVTAYQVAIEHSQVAITGPSVTRLRGGGELERSATGCLTTSAIDEVRADYAVIGGERWWFDAASCATASTRVVASYAPGCR